MNLQPIADFIRYLKFTDGLSSSDVIGWILAALDEAWDSDACAVA